METQEETVQYSDSSECLLAAASGDAGAIAENIVPSHADPVAELDVPATATEGEYRGHSLRGWASRLVVWWLQQLLASAD